MLKEKYEAERDSLCKSIKETAETGKFLCERLIKQLDKVCTVGDFKDIFSALKYIESELHSDYSELIEHHGYVLYLESEKDKYEG